MVIINQKEVHVWILPLCDTDFVDKKKHLLTPSEISRYSQYRQKIRGHQYLASRIFLRSILGGYLNKPEREISFFKNQYKKPFLSQCYQNKLQFNLSHSDAYSILAITKNDLIGVDTETIKFIKHQNKIIERYWSPIEKKIYSQRKRKDKSFFIFWTQKEAFSKAIGLGIAKTKFKNVSTKGNMDQKNQIIKIHQSKKIPKKWHLQTFQIDKDNLFSVAVRKESPTFIKKTWDKFSHYN